MLQSNHSKISYFSARKFFFIPLLLSIITAFAIWASGSGDSGDSQSIISISGPMQANYGDSVHFSASCSCGHEVTWSSSFAFLYTPSIINGKPTISASGLAFVPGLYTISASCSGGCFCNARTCRIIPPSPAVTLDGPSPILLGELVTYTATGSPEAPFSNGYFWKVSGDCVQVVGENGSELMLRGISPGTATITVQYYLEGGYWSEPVTKTVSVKELRVSIEGPNLIQIGEQKAVIAIGTPPNSAGQYFWSPTTNPTDCASWSEEGSILNVTGQSKGALTVQVCYYIEGGWFSEPATKTIIIGESIVEVLGPTSVFVTETVQMQACGSPEGGHLMNWQVIFDTGQASIDEAGKLFGIKEGIVYVKVGYKYSDCDETYSSPFEVTVKPPEINIIGPSKVYLDVPTPMIAKGLPAGGKLIDWKVKNGTGAAKIDEDGVLTGTKVGEVYVTVNYQLPDIEPITSEKFTVIIAPLTILAFLEDPQFSSIYGEIYSGLDLGTLIFTLNGKEIPLDALDIIKGDTAYFDKKHRIKDITIYYCPNIKDLIVPGMNTVNVIISDNVKNQMNPIVSSFKLP